MKGIVYILQSQISGRYYVGSTSDLPRRLDEHRMGHTHTSRRLPDFQLVFSQELETLQLARKVEKRIKSWKRKDFIDRIVADRKIAFLDQSTGH